MLLLIITVFVITLLIHYYYALLHHSLLHIVTVFVNAMLLHHYYKLLHHSLLGQRFAAALLPLQFRKIPRSHHKGATGSQWSGFQNQASASTKSAPTRNLLYLEYVWLLALFLVSRKDALVHYLWFHWRMPVGNKEHQPGSATGQRTPGTGKINIWKIWLSKESMGLLPNLKNLGLWQGLVKGRWSVLTGQDRNVTQSARPQVWESAGTPSQWLSASEPEFDSYCQSTRAACGLVCQLQVNKWAQGLGHIPNPGAAAAAAAAATGSQQAREQLPLSMGLQLNLKVLGLTSSDQATL